MENWITLGNCFCQDLANTINATSKDVSSICYWLSSPITTQSTISDVPEFLWARKDQLAPSMESRFLENQVLNLKEQNPTRILVNLFHIESGHYRFRDTDFIFYMPHIEALDSETKMWLEQNCSTVDSAVSLQDYKNLILRLSQRFRVPIDLFVRMRPIEGGFCYLSEWDSYGKLWREEIGTWAIENLRVIFLDDIVKVENFPYFLVEEKQKLFGYRYSIRTDQEHLSPTTFTRILSHCYPERFNGLEAQTRDEEEIWSAYLRKVVEKKQTEKPSCDFPVSKYLLRTLKELCKVGLFNDSNLLKEHAELVEKTYPNTPFYQRYIAQCDAAMDLITNRRKKFN